MTEEFRFAVVPCEDTNGIIVQFEGETEASSKKFTRLQSCNCSEGDRILMAPASGSYVAIGVVDRKKIIAADTATSATSATNATNATTATKANQLTTARTIALTGDVTASGNFNGTANLSMEATGVKANAVKDQNYTAARTVTFRVASVGKLQFKSSYYGSSYWYNMDGTQA